MRAWMLTAAVVGALGAATQAQARSMVTCADPDLRYELTTDDKTPSPWTDAPVLTTLASPHDLLAYRGRRVIVSGVTLKNADFRKLKLENVCFEDSDLTGSFWTGAETAGLIFIRTKLDNADLAGAGFKGALLLGSGLNGVRAGGVRLNGAQMRGGEFDGLDLRGADLRDFRLSCSMINGEWECAWPEHGVDARGADLTRASLDVYLTKDWRFDGARLDETIVTMRQIEQFRTATATGPVRLAASWLQADLVTLAPEEWNQLVAAWSEPPVGPSFDCAQAATPVEKTICQAKYSDLPGLDRALAVIYREALDTGRTTTADQRRWLASRSGCLTHQIASDCLSDLYRARITALTTTSGLPTFLTPGADATYSDFDLPVTPEFRAGPLYRRLAPLIVASAASGLHVRAVAPGRLHAEGWANGVNGHSCSLSAEGHTPDAFAFNPKTGWFGGPHEPFETDRRTWEDVLRLAGEEAEVADWNAEGLSDYVGCGARAYFQPMQRIPGA